MKVVRNKLLLSFYGDDFTGSTDVMETLSMNGIPAALFLQPPTKDEVSGFTLKRKMGGDHLRAFGVAGIARSLSPERMKKELDPIFAAMKEIPTDYVQYKVCSTLDSSPEIGNIGVATDTAIRYFPSIRIPMLIGAPFLNRYVVFSNLFARIGAVTHRLDRHPVMANHPVTPMLESDVRRHIGLQTDRPFTTIDIHKLDENYEEVKTAYQNAEINSYILFDTVTYDHLRLAGQLIYECWQGKTELLVGSSGITYGLASFLREREGNGNKVKISYPGQARNMLVVAGSCSPVTARQMHYAVQFGFELIPVNMEDLVTNPELEFKRLSSLVNAMIKSGRRPIVYTADGPDDPSIEGVRRKLGDQTNTVIGSVYGRVIESLIDYIGQVRVVVVGGDTSGYVSRYLQIYALEMACPIAPGAPLCVAHTRDPRFDGLEIALKGGQNGKDDYFQRVFEGIEILD